MKRKWLLLHLHDDDEICDRSLRINTEHLMGYYRCRFYEEEGDDRKYTGNATAIHMKGESHMIYVKDKPEIIDRMLGIEWEDKEKAESRP